MKGQKFLSYFFILNNGHVIQWSMAWLQFQRNAACIAFTLQ